MPYKIVVFIDSNVALQGRGLSELPWKEIDKEGPILILVTPTVLTEVDSKKNDARLGDHARRFNRLLLPLLEDKTVTTIRSSPAPQVDLALADCPPILWEAHTSLDRAEPDDRIIAEVLNTKNVPSEASRLFISQDIRPLSLAQRHGCTIKCLGENWLRPKDISATEKRLAAAKRELESLKSKQPKLLLEWVTPTTSINVIRVKNLLDSEREEIEEKILQSSPMPQQEAGAIYSSFHTYDHTLKDRYKKWSNLLIPKFVQQMETNLELMYNQIEISLTIKNEGIVQAESLLLEITSTGGWMNKKMILVPSKGPLAPKLRLNHFPDTYNLITPIIYPPQGRHEVIIKDPPERSTYVQITCDDFRQGGYYKLSLIVWLNPYSNTPFKLNATATAANLHGEVSESICFEQNITDVEIFNLLDRNTLEYKQQSQVHQKFLIAQANNEDFSNFEFYP